MKYESTLSSSAGCDQFLAGAEPKMAFRIPHGTFPVLTDPEFVPPERADFMRPDDWIVGLQVGRHVRCYPAHMLDNVHVVNDTIDGSSYAVMHCEICCSNAVFQATLDGRRVTFETGGLFGGTLALFDEQTRSMWSHGMGVAFDGVHAGRRLERVESFQASYAEWVALHPDTEVMVWPAPTQHPDCRHGHGTDVWFGTAGIEPLVLRTMAIRSDPRLAEHEIVVSVFTPDGQAAVPLRDLTRAGLIAFSVGGHELVTLSAGPDSALTGTFRPRLLDQPDVSVELVVKDGRFLDRRTGSVFRADGLAVTGLLVGERLEPVPTMMNKWHSLTCFLPGVPIVRCPASTPLDEGRLAPLFTRLRSSGFAIEPTRRVVALELPHGAVCGFDLLMNGEPFRILEFTDESVAQDQLLWTTHALQVGELVLASTPPLYADWTNTTPYPASEVAWSSLIDDPTLRESLRQSARHGRHDTGAPLTNLTGFLLGLRTQGFRVDVKRAAYRETLPVGARTGLVVDIEGDPFIVLLFESGADAARRVPQPAHSIVAGHIVLQSDPPDIYAVRDRATQRRSDAEISWSRLIGSESFFAAALRSACS
jgi:hypothetical protein